MKPADEDAAYFARPLVCDLCERWAEGDAWPTHEEFGFRYCPICRLDRITVIPRLLTDLEMEKWNNSNTGW